MGELNDLFGYWSQSSVTANGQMESASNNEAIDTMVLAYVRRGWPILPLVPNAKRPLTPNGLKDAATGHDIIESWLYRWPNANIGIATGTRSGIIVLDVDVKEGAEGAQSLSDLVTEHGQLTSTLAVTTPSGGQHYYFKHPGGNVKNRVGFRSGLDVRGDGGYIVVPPSSIDGKPYEWINPDQGIADAPEWLIDEIRNKRGSSIQYTEAEASIVRGITGAPEGQRNESVFRYASSLRAKDYPRDEAELLVLTKARNCNPPLPEDEALQCLYSAYTRYEPSQIRKLTEMGNTERLVDQYGDRIRYIADLNMWMIWR